MPGQHQTVWIFVAYLPYRAYLACSGYVQGGSDGMPILGDFVVKYAEHAAELGVPTDDLYQALVDTAENTVSGTIFLLGISSLSYSRKTGTLVRPKTCL